MNMRMPRVALVLCLLAGMAGCGVTQEATLVFPVPAQPPVDVWGTGRTAPAGAAEGDGWGGAGRGDWGRAGNVDRGGRTSAGWRILAGYDPSRRSAMVDWSPSEFSRLRLQVARDKSRSGESDNQVWLQYVMSLGAHGAHKF